MTIPRKPFYIAWNVWVSLMILLGGFLLGTLHNPNPHYFCQGKECVRVLPGEDAQTQYLNQILEERHSLGK